MTAVRANGVTIEYEEMGSPDAPAILMIMGLGMQLVAWPDTLCEGLAARGFRVLRFDNRDVGLSSRISSPGGRSRTLAMLAGAFLRLPVRPPYTLGDMALDTVGLMDALKIGGAHVVGASMGGMIAQIVAAERPDRVRSLVSIMSSPAPVAPRPKVLAALLRPPPRDGDEAIRRMHAFFRMIGGSGYPPTDEELTARIDRSVRRSWRPDAFGRQLLAIEAAPSRVAMLRRVSAPTLVIHGADDPLVPLVGGKMTAAAVPNARLRVVPGMGHFLPEALVPLLIDEIADHCFAAEGARNARAALIN